MTTKKPKTTTPVDYEYEIYEFEASTIPLKIRETSSVDIFMSIFGMFLSIFHIFLLTRKNLRKDFISFTILVIFISNLAHFSSVFLWNFLEWGILYQVRVKLCGDVAVIHSRSHQVVKTWITAVQLISRHFSSVLVLLAGILKIVSIRIRVLIAVLFHLFALGVFMAWHVKCHLQYKYVGYESEISDKKCKASYIFYEQQMKPNVFKSQKLVNDCVTYALVSLLTISTVFLFVRLRKVIKTKNGEDDHMLLVFLLSLSFLLSECLDFSVLLFEKFVLKRYYNIQEYFIRYQIVIRTVITIISVGQCFICYLTSSEYQEEMRQVLSWKRKSKAPAADPATISTTRNMSSSRA